MAPSVTLNAFCKNLPNDPTKDAMNFCLARSMGECDHIFGSWGKE